MPYVKVDIENTTSIDLYFEDHGDGEGQPVVLIHGWPLNGRSWEKQTAALLKAGYRVIAYDRRGFGNSSRPSFGYDYDTFAADLDTLMKHCDLRDAVLVGFSMGTGEVARYLGKYGSERVSRAVMIGSVPPFLLKTPDNPAGVDRGVFDKIKKSIEADRLQFLTQFLSDFYNLDVLRGKSVSDEIVHWSWHAGSVASAKGTLDCVDAWLTDFRADLSLVKVPTLIIHGDADRILPIEATGHRLGDLIEDSRSVFIPGAPTDCCGVTPRK